MNQTLFRTPSALLPIGMAVAALTVVAAHVVMFGTARQADEGTAAHLWQLLTAAEVPAIAWFAARWLPVRPGQAIFVLAIQGLSVLAALFPVWWFQW
jgi:hypothetical protein